MSPRAYFPPEETNKSCDWVASIMRLWLVVLFGFNSAEAVGDKTSDLSLEIRGPLKDFKELRFEFSRFNLFT